jgi:hypothetical protein
VSAHTYRVAQLVVDSAGATPVTFVAVVTSIIDTFLGVKEKPCVAYDGVLDFSKRTGTNALTLVVFSFSELAMTISTHTFPHYAFCS